MKKAAVNPKKYFGTMGTWKTLSLLSFFCLLMACQNKTENATPDEAIVYIKGAEILHERVVEPWNDGNTLTINFLGAYTGIEDLSKKAPADIDVTFKVDLATVETYNETNGTNYTPLPAGSISAASFSSTIEQGSQETPELSVSVDITEGLTPFTEYLLPISVDQVSNGSEIDERKRTIFFKVFVMSNAPVEIKVGILTHTSTGTDFTQVIADIANAEDPDILVVRDIDRNTTRAGGADRVEQLRDLLNIKNYRFAKQQDLQGGEYGSAIYSRYPFKDFTSHILTDAGAASNRPLGIAEVEVLGQTLKIATVLLDFQAPVPNTNSSLGHIGSATLPPTIFLGTFQQNPNASPATAVYQALFDAGFALPCTDCPGTYGHPTPTSWTDMVVFRPEARFEAVEHKAVLTSVANTPHKPVFTTLDVYFYADKED